MVVIGNLAYQTPINKGSGITQYNVSPDFQNRKVTNQIRGSQRKPFKIEPIGWLLSELRCCIE